MTRTVRVSASVGLALGGILGLAGTFAPSESLRGLAWGIDGLALVAASALLTVAFLRAGHDLVASGFLIFAVGQGLVVSGAAMDLARSAPSFGAGAGLWAVALILISIPPVLPRVARLLGVLSALLFTITALMIFGGSALVPTSSPLPYFAYPIFVATLGAWIWTLLSDRVEAAPPPDAI
ncbi:MAG: hypothetical protein KJO98_15615 [Rhodothermia bacterium]|nr:hypothetical protein [Rhodothermia bacterium]NNE34969.1 hypothetical protein [Rhodothermales bacterium]